PVTQTTSMSQLLKRSEIFFDDLRSLDQGLVDIDPRVSLEIETRIKYEGYIERQEREVEKLSRMEDLGLPEGIDYRAIHGLTTEVREKLSKVRPVNLGQASRISGITPAAIMALQIHLKRGSIIKTRDLEEKGAANGI
ncbi:MAG TPA: tRNA uridine-5-carboxymethylaminomethyl(34) synthesis enzyme MnmG, partial [Desulfobacteraceae bacterium]|nr:tRNA uridine-5-carboxymethylaminomethyl(34) synthesis enzyme MnmG [Desulfobacteraceae bacterium]